jgi:hypothetical protein
MIKIIAMETPSMSHTSNQGEMERIEDVEKIREFFLYPEDNFSDDEVFYGFYIPKSEEEVGQIMPFCIDDLIEEGYVMVGNRIIDVEDIN